MNEFANSAEVGETQQHAPESIWRQLWRHPDAVAAREVVLLILISGFLLLFGLVPRIGGDQLGLVGADEPRYAQVAREML
ncbi:MAG TPA: glycosyltransferase family 39 protein, partial [Edaphobacter sp.]